MQPIGMRVMKKMLRMKKALQERVATDPEAQTAVSEENLDLALDIIIEAVRPEVREALATHIDDSVGPKLLAQIAGQIVNSMSDLDPTPPGSSSDGSAPDATGSASTDGAEPAASTPST